MSLLVQQLNTDNDILYLIQDYVEKLRLEKINNNIKYSDIVNDLNFFFDKLHTNYRIKTLFKYDHYTSRKIFNHIHYVNNIYQQFGDYRMNETMKQIQYLFSGFKYKYNEIKYPQYKREYYKRNKHYPTGSSHILPHLIQRLPKAVKNYQQFYQLDESNDVTKQILKSKAGILGWSKCNYD